MTCKSIHSDPQGLQTVLKTQFYFSTVNMKYLKSFQGTEGYQGRKCIRRRKKPHISILEVNKDGGEPEAQNLLLSTIILPEIVSEHCTDRILNNLRGYAKQAPKIIFLNFLPFLSQDVIVIRRTSSMRATEKFHRKVKKLKETIFQAGQSCCTDNKTTE